VARLIDRAEGLGPGLGPVLLQLPPTLRADPELLEECLRQFPTWVRVAVEPRHPSWFDDRVRQVLERRGAALVWSDRKSRLLTPTWRTADWAYLRMHEGRALPWPRYGRTALAARVGQLAEAFPDPAAEVFVYFNNDPGGAAVEDAVGFTRAACRADRQVVVPVGVGSGR
jgi:uncharacterized protein YecE (DUF72 family)